MQTKAYTRAQAPQEEQASSLTRRNFLVLGLGALTTVAAIETGVAGFMFLRSRSLEGEFGGVIKAGEIEKFPPGSVTEFPEDNFFLVRAEDGGFLAVYQRCPHLGCTVNWNAEKSRFLCPCHASSFDMYGNFLNQPVPRALDYFPVSIDKNAVVRVDTSNLQRRESYSPDQLTYAS